jgi:hypothetical protein
MSGRHAAVRVYYPGSPPECQVCGKPVLSIPGEPIRHVAEAAVAALPRDASPADVARAVVERVYGDGLLRRRPVPPRQRQEPDLAEAAAAVRARYERPERALLRVG